MNFFLLTHELLLKSMAPALIKHRVLHPEPHQLPPSSRTLQHLNVFPVNWYYRATTTAIRRPSNPPSAPPCPALILHWTWGLCAGSLEQGYEGTTVRDDVTQFCHSRYLTNRRPRATFHLSPAGTIGQCPTRCHLRDKRCSQHTCWPRPNCPSDVRLKK